MSPWEGRGAHYLVEHDIRLEQLGPSGRSEHGIFSNGPSVRSGPAIVLLDPDGRLRQVGRRNHPRESETGPAAEDHHREHRPPVAENGSGVTAPIG